MLRGDTVYPCDFRKSSLLPACGKNLTCKTVFKRQCIIIMSSFFVLFIHLALPLRHIASSFSNFALGWQGRWRAGSPSATYVIINGVITVFACVHRSYMNVFLFMTAFILVVCTAVLGSPRTVDQMKKYEKVQGRVSSINVNNRSNIGVVFKSILAS